MTDLELLLHAHQVHGPIPMLAHTPEAMTTGVLARLRDAHDEWHDELHNHTHNYPIFGDATVAEGWKGVHYRDTDEGLGRPAGVWIVACDKHDQCFYHVSAPTEEIANQRYDKHDCPHDGHTYYGASVTTTLIQELWEIADGLYYKLQKPANDTERDHLRYELRGVSKGLLTFVKPYFGDLKAVAAEISKRYNLREAGQAYETPGTQTRIFDMPKPPMTVAERASKVLTDEEKEAIKFAIDSKVFTVKQLAETYDVSEAVISEVSS